MFDQRRAAAQSEPTREQPFTERYEVMLTWALQLTNQQRDATEDFVQDAFVQFVPARTQLEEIENINGYLRRLLILIARRAVKVFIDDPGRLRSELERASR